MASTTNRHRHSTATPLPIPPPGLPQPRFEQAVISPPPASTPGNPLRFAAWPSSSSTSTGRNDGHSDSSLGGVGGSGTLEAWTQVVHRQPNGKITGKDKVQSRSKQQAKRTTTRVMPSIRPRKLIETEARGDSEQIRAWVDVQPLGQRHSARKPCRGPEANMSTTTHRPHMPQPSAAGTRHPCLCGPHCCNPIALCSRNRWRVQVLSFEPRTCSFVSSTLR